MKKKIIQEILINKIPLMKYQGVTNKKLVKIVILIYILKIYKLNALMINRIKK